MAVFTSKRASGSSSACQENMASILSKVSRYLCPRWVDTFPELRLGNLGGFFLKKEKKKKKRRRRKIPEAAADETLRVIIRFVLVYATR